MWSFYFLHAIRVICILLLWYVAMHWKDSCLADYNLHSCGTFQNYFELISENHSEIDQSGFLSIDSMFKFLLGVMWHSMSEFVPYLPYSTLFATFSSMFIL